MALTFLPGSTLTSHLPPTELYIEFLAAHGPHIENGTFFLPSFSPLLPSPVCSTPLVMAKPPTLITKFFSFHPHVITSSLLHSFPTHCLHSDFEQYKQYKATLYPFSPLILGLHFCQSYFSKSITSSCQSFV